jgi:methane/ammonia monooxygenase subunit B
MGGRRLLGVLVVGAVLGLGSVASAHGEAADLPFLKDLTAAFYDVQISPTVVQVGQDVTLSGRVRVLETWPYTLHPPEVAYITPVVPGAEFVLKDRTVNGQEAPDEIVINRGGEYEFRMVMEARQAGRWHVHPGFAVQGVGTLIGPGAYIDVNPAPDGSRFRFLVPLANAARTVDLETLGTARVWWWAFLGFIPGIVWMIYWTVPKPTVTRLAVTARLRPVDDGRDFGLITRNDHRWCNVIAGLTALLLVAGWVEMTAAYPVRIPQQTIRFTPPPLPPGPHLADVAASGGTWDANTNTLVLHVDVKNVGTSPVRVTQFIMAMATFVNRDATAPAVGPKDFVQKALTVGPDGAIAPGESATLQLTVNSPLFAVERLIPIGEPQQQIAGLLRLEDAAGRQQLATIEAPVVPAEYVSAAAS